MGKKHNKKYNPDKLCKQKLLKSEIQKYKEIGEIDYSQRWLELFTPTITSDLFTIMNSCSDNQRKAGYIKKELAYYGFREVGLGTNIYTMANPAYPGVVFKFALDDNGIVDNFNDAVLEELVNDYLGKRRYTTTLARHPSGIVSVQQRKVLVSSQDRMDVFRSSILKTLKKLSEKFLIVDLSPSLYLFNYGIDRNGDWCFVDASDLYPLENITEKIRCNKAVGYNDKKQKMIRCGGRLRYNADFSAVICEKCGMEFLPLEVRPNENKEAKSMALTNLTDGTSLEKREKWRQKELAAIRGETITDEDLELDDEDEKEEPATIEELQPAPQPKYPSKDHPLTVFVDPNPTVTTAEVVEEDEDDEEESVDESSVVEPKSFSDFVKSFRGKEDADEDEEEEEEEPEEHYVDTFANESAEEPVVEEEPVQEDRLEYTVINTTEEDDPNELPGIYIKIIGDFNKAYQDYGLPIYISFGDDKTIQKVVSSSAMRNILTPGVTDALEEMNAIRGDPDGIKK